MKPVLSDHSKIDRTKVVRTGGSLMQVERIAECSWAFCYTFDLHLAIIGLKNIFWSSFELPFKTSFTVSRPPRYKVSIV